MRHLARNWPRQLTGMGMRPPLFLTLLTLTIYLVWRGYDFAVSDQEEVVPYLLHLLDPTLFANDWLVGIQTAQFGPRTLFVWMTWLPARLIGPEATFAILYCLSWWGTASALYSLSLQLTRERLAAAVAVLLALIFSPKFTLGGNDLVTWILTPSVAAWPFALWGLIFFVRGRMLQCAVCLGAATWMQALVGLQPALLLGLLLMWRRGIINRRLWTLVGVYTACALPALGPLVWLQLTGNTPADGYSLFYVLAEFRAPHHYLFTSFTVISALGFMLLLAVGLVYFSQLPEAHKPMVKRLLLLIAGLCLASLLLTEVWPVDFVMKLQLFKLTVIAKVLLIICVANGAAALILAAARHHVEAFFNHGHYVLGATLLLVATLVLVSPDALGLRPGPVTGDSPAEEQIADWARTSTDKDALFAVLPQWAGFRSKSHRAIVVNFKAIPFHPPEMAEWFRRLLDVAPIDPPKRGGLAIMPVLDGGFLALTDDEVHRLAERYDFQYIVRPHKEAPDGFEMVYAAGDLAVWAVVPRQ
ncbi:MAG: hypothetical protein OXU68_11295 [Bacteroidota bacterium]|nr:hypothetical protein [Bacteroidota bacterium]